jgi:hypothetical protein
MVAKSRDKGSNFFCGIQDGGAGAYRHMIAVYHQINYHGYSQVFLARSSLCIF